MVSRSGVVAIGGGLGAGLIAGLFGVGGGVLLVPVLVLVLGRDQHVAHATSLVAVTLAATAGAVRFGFEGAIAWPGAAAMGLGAVIGAQGGAALMTRVPAARLRQIFAALLVLLAVRFLVSGAGPTGVDDAVPRLDVLLMSLHFLAGVVGGIVSALLGVGGGVINVPALTLLFGYGQHVAEGTSLAVIAPAALAGAISHSRDGYTDWRLGLLLGTSAVVGAVAGASVALGLDALVLTRMFGSLLAVMAILVVRSEANTARQARDGVRHG